MPIRRTPVGGDSEDEARQIDHFIVQSISDLV